MALMSSDTAGPILGNEDGRMMPPPGAGQQPQDVPCPACQGAGMLPAEAAEQIAGVLGASMEEAQGAEMGMEAMPPEMAGAAAGGPPQSPVTGRTQDDMAGIRDYAANRPAHLQHQPFDENEVAASGKRVRERMRQGGRLGG